VPTVAGANALPSGNGFYQRAHRDSPDAAKLTHDEPTGVVYVDYRGTVQLRCGGQAPVARITAFVRPSNRRYLCLIDHADPAAVWQVDAAVVVNDQI
jgi:hypothetical protein